ncbi:MAG: hypothetical protein JRH13_09055 [Deltaproteobacteria bacterium]|nr:hypothetical protein [Deltaproteobacteria bacterium]MBW2016819.1 hypothetical protein [Deltaproteobacteria bacterium]MBW2129499.1 hypothetical protein [Deltaproteobacteria bacterium]MBW2303840.1 hypothetical protein [Deltaproteobacteria bacterium]
MPGFNKLHAATGDPGLEGEAGRPGKARGRKLSAKPLNLRREYFLYHETFEKRSILFKIKPPARKAYAPEGKTKILTIPLRIPSGRHHTLKYFED